MRCGLDLQNKVAIVTGSSRGIGKAIAIAFATAGARVVVAARSESPGRVPGTIHETVHIIREAGGEALAIPCNIADESHIESLVATTKQTYGQVDVLVNNAGVSVATPLINTETRHWDLLMRVNLRGAFLSCKYVLPHMIQRQSGSIINITAGNPEMSATPSQSVGVSIAYSATKYGLNALTVGLAEEVRRHGIAVNGLNPGIIKSEGAIAVAPEDPKEAAAYWNSSHPSLPEAVCESALFLATQTAETFSGRLVNREDYGLGWP